LSNDYDVAALAVLVMAKTALAAVPPTTSTAYSNSSPRGDDPEPPRMNTVKNHHNTAATQSPKPGASMATIHLHETTTATPEQFVAGLTDFGPGREQVFPNSADDDLVVHDKGPNHADVTEGSKGVWERLHYDWSDPHRVVVTTTDSNVWSDASGYTYTLARQPDGTTDEDVVIVREGKNLRGRALAILLGTIGKGNLRKANRNAVKAIEARTTQPERS
jgi:hypothetical protein